MTTLQPPQAKRNDYQRLDMDQPDDPNSRPIIADRVLVNGIETTLTFTEDGKLLWNAGGQKCLTVEREVLGFCTHGRKIRLRCVVVKGDRFCYVWDRRGLVRENFVFELLSENSQRLWCQKLREYIDSLGRPKKLFIFVNPFGGKKIASKIFIDVVKPLLEDAEIQITMQETKHQLHAKKVAHTMDLSKYEGIICVSGDGLVVEVVNGLLEREDWSSAIKMPIGVVPAGTGNGMAKSLLDSVGQPCTAFNAVLAIIRGHKRSLDVATILQGEIKFFSVLMLAWGLVADIDIESEKYRWMGSARLDFYGLQRILNLRRYDGRICFVPAPGFEDYGLPANYNDGPSDTQRNRDNSLEQAFDVQQNGYQGPDVKLENLDWRTINGPFLSVWLHNVPWGSEDTLAAPDAKFSDGYLDLIIVRDCSRLSLLSLMTEMNSGGHVRSPLSTYLKVKAFVLEPGPRTDDPTKEGIIDSDGEVLARGKGTYKHDQKGLMSYDKLQIKIDQGLATVFSPV